MAGRGELQQGYARIMEMLRYEGFPVLVWRGLRKSIAPLGDVRLLTFYEKDLVQPLPRVSARVPVTITVATQADFDQVTALIVKRRRPRLDLVNDELRRVRQIVSERSERGDKCFVAKLGADIVHSNWVILDSMEWPAGTGHRITLPPDEAYTTDATTAEAWRGKGIHTAVLLAMLRFLQELGYRKAYAQVRTDNRSAWKSHERLGWRRTGTILLFRPVGRKVTWIWRLRGNLQPSKEMSGRLLVLSQGQSASSDFDLN